MIHREEEASFVLVCFFFKYYGTLALSLVEHYLSW